MRSTDIRLRTKLIIRRGNQWLVGRGITGDLVFSTSRYDAWWTRDRNDAADVARMVGGDVWLFNSVIGEAVMLNSDAFVTVQRDRRVGSSC